MISSSVAPKLRIRERAPAAPKQQRSIEKRQKLLDAGRALFAEKGYEAASIGEITSHARTASGGFYQFFFSKRQFLVVLMNDFLARLAALNLRPQAATGDLREALRKFLADAFRVDHAHFGVVRAWQEAVRSDAELAQLEQEIEAWTNARVLGVFQLLSKHPRARPGADLRAFARMMNRHFWSLLARGARLSPRQFAHEVQLSADVIYNYLFSDSPRQANPKIQSRQPIPIGITFRAGRPRMPLPRRILSFRSAPLFIVALTFLALGAAADIAPQFSPRLYESLRWRCIGPFRGGRTVAASGVPGQPNVFYMAPNNGGVWKSTDFGNTWHPIFDGQPTGSIGALAVAPSNPEIIYVGSGEGLRRPDLSVGDGIYKSTDAGATWKHLGLRDAQQITNILVDPRNPDRVFVAALGHPYGPNEERGVLRSLDGGATWQKILYKDENTGTTDLAFDPKNSQTLYAVLWNSRRPPWTTSGPLEGHTGGLYKSIDGGNLWRPLTGGLPTNAQGLGRIGIAIAPSDPDRLYALVDAAPEVGGLYRSADAGETWLRVDHEPRIWGRGFDFAWVRVSPENADTIYICNTSTYRSTDAGQTFTAIKGAPGGDDYHAIWINPENPKILLLASDQGATISVNAGESWSSWYNQPTAQFYHVITDNQFPYWVYGGQQESGSAGTSSRSDWGEISFREWHPVGAEEYGYIAPDPLHPNLIYGGKVTRFDTTTGQAQDVSPVILRTGKFRFNRTAPLIFSPADPHILYLGSNVLFQSTDAAHNWQIISPDLTREDPGVPANLGHLADNDKKHRGVIYSLAPSPLDANLIWAGSDDGLLWLTRDAGKNWQNVSPSELTPWSKIAQLDASHFDKDTAYAAVNRFRVDDLHAYIYRTHDGGKSWQKITAGLPDDAPVNVVREDPVRRGLLFAGTERAVWVSFNDGDSWQSLQLNLPATSMRDLVIHGDDIVVGTHGRSFWILDDISPLRQITEEVARADAFFFKPATAIRIRRNINTDTPLPPEIPAGKNPPDGALFDYYLSFASSAPVTLEIYDGASKLLRRLSSTDASEATLEELRQDLNVPMYWIRPPQFLSAAAGMHRIVWDLRLSSPGSVAHEYPISAIVHDTPRYPVGHAVLPGVYTVKLTVGTQTFSQPLEIKMDPRVTASTADLAEQFNLASQICDVMDSSFRALTEVRSLRAQIKSLPASNQKGALANSLRAFDQKLAALESDSAPPQSTTGAALSVVGLAKLNGDFGKLLSVVDSADARPTEAARDTFSDLQRSASPSLAQWNDLMAHDLPVLNDQLRKSMLPPLDPSLPPPHESSFEYGDEP